MKTFGKALRSARMAKFPKLSAAKFAEKVLHMEAPTYRTYERGEAEPGFETLHRICRALEITPNDLLPEAAETETLPKSA